MAKKPSAEIDEAVDDADAEVEVHVLKLCNFMDDHGVFHTYAPGIRKMPKEHAKHWFVAHHLENPPEPIAYTPGSALDAEQHIKNAQIQRERAQLDEQQQRALAAQREADLRAETLRQAQGDIMKNSKDALAREKAASEKAEQAVKGNDNAGDKKTPGRVKLADGK